jgi:hypothetical protein
LYPCGPIGHSSAIAEVYIVSLVKHGGPLPIAPSQIASGWFAGFGWIDTDLKRLRAVFLFRTSAPSSLTLTALHANLLGLSLPRLMC